MPETSSTLLSRALDPARSVVVEACAGSGKTWLLASRIVCLLLNGIAPGEILAITFTRKAAREIEDRVIAWLRLLATGNKEQIAGFFAERGLAFSEARLRDARALYERVLSASPRLAVNTFHGWFLQLIAVSPISSGLTGNTLVDSASLLFDELWQSFVSGFRGKPESATAQALVKLLEYGDYDFARPMIRRAMDRRAEWLAYGGEKTDIAEKILADLRERSGAGEPGEALSDFFESGLDKAFRKYLVFLEKSDLKTDQKAAEKLHIALDEKSARVERFDALRAVFLTQKDTLRERQLTSTLERRFGIEGAGAFIELHTWLGRHLIECTERQTAENILAFNRDACAVFSAFLAHIDAFKQARRQIDFVDAEWNVFRLLRDEETAAFLQARLDARYRHVLLDEFQDTNPLQWQILLSWLGAYSDNARPVVFLVGDPKQSIYRFRRAEPRLFASAAAFLKSEYDAVFCFQDTTRRNAKPIVDTVNALFLNRPEFAPFRPQDSLADSLPGRVELLPLYGNRAKEEKKTPPLALRDPLTEPETEPEDKRREREAEALALRISEMTGKNGDAWQITERTPDGLTIQRPARYGDIMLLIRSRSHLSNYERALAAADIPFEAGSRGGLLTALEIRDCVALLEFLVMPEDSLKLAQTLKSPLFSCGDEELMLLAQRGDFSWWERLKAAAAEDGAPSRTKRAARLLAGWLEIASHLPAHDLMDRIFHEGELIARYRIAVPEAAAAGVEANLRALLLLALELDAGRYPSLPRFIDALRELRDADAGDAPDEGEIDAPSDDRVRILTIHGAKGLEAPIVWLLDSNTVPRNKDIFGAIIDWPPQDARPTHFSFYTRQAERGAFRKALFDAEAAAEKREELNLLYVAITRARQVFIASGIENARNTDATSYRLLETALKTLTDASGNTPENPENALIYGDDLPRVPANGANVPVPHTVRIPERPPATGCRREESDNANLRFGILFHALIECRMKGEAPGNGWKALGFDDSEHQRVCQITETLLTAPALRRFFDPACYRRAWDEIELADSEGRLKRIDRLVDDGDTLWVLDYKSSRPDTKRLEEYRAQVSAYCQAVSAIFPARKARGALVFSDASLVEIVEIAPATANSDMQ
ncbi:MAG: UvrD-helicase domain-containing protein [Candidatus Accumulibacter sp.]|jgi:ATP-dependent helicase/nuclease subunit A|nr:UvrD-helicase domain-containing protein [Accumulibacter sp.]